MNKQEILNKVDHTLLAQTATWEDIKVICDDGMKYNVASVCIPPHFIKKAKQYVGESLKICTVIGFPNGYQTTETKVFETADSIKNGADEIDMVINIGNVKSNNYEEILNEINAIKEACKGKVLKVIIETCLLTDKEKIEMCKIISNSNADYIKTSTGFSIAGATLEDINLFKQYISNNKKIKAAGGISSFDDAEKFIEAGADRLGTSRLVRIIKEN